MKYLRSSNIRVLLLFIFVFLLPTQLGKHFFFPFSFVNGVRIDYLAPTVYLIDIIALFLIFLNLKEIKKHIMTHQRLFLTVSLAFIINIAISPEPIIALYTITRLYIVYFIYIIFSRVDAAKETKEIRKIVIYGLLFGALFQAILTTLQFVNGGALQGIFYYFGERFFTLSTPGIATAALQGREILRPYGTFSHPNSLGGFYALVYALALMLLNRLNRGGKEKNLRLPLLILSFVASFLVFFSFSKAAIGVFLLVTVAAFFLQKDKRACLPCAVSRLIVPFIIGLVFFQAKGDSYSVEKRLRLIEQSLSLFQKYPLFGVGFGNHLYLQARFPTPYPEFFLQPVHNIFLLLLVQGGLVIAAICLWLAIQKINKKTVLAVLVIAVTGLVDHYWLTLIQNMLLIGVVFGLMESVE